MYPSTCMTVADAYARYHQIRLNEESKPLTTFITPQGSFRYWHTPMGHCSAQDAFTKRFDDVIATVPRKLKWVDDMLLRDHSIEDVLWHYYIFLRLVPVEELPYDLTSLGSRGVQPLLGNPTSWEYYQLGDDLTGFQMPQQPSMSDIRLVLSTR